MYTMRTVIRPAIRTIVIKLRVGIVIIIPVIPHVVIHSTIIASYPGANSLKVIEI